MHTQKLTPDIKSKLSRAKVNSKQKKPWVDLAEYCEHYDPLHVVPSSEEWHTCWDCRNYYPEFGDSGEWVCHLPRKETERKMKAAILYEGQTTFPMEASV